MLELAYTIILYAGIEKEDVKIQIGNNVSFNSNVMLNADIGGNIRIGDNVLIGPNVVLRLQIMHFPEGIFLSRNRGILQGLSYRG